MNGRLPVAVVALALVVAGLAGRVAVRALQTARHGDARDFAILYTCPHLYRAGTSLYDPGMDHLNAVNENPALAAAPARLGTLHSHEGYVHPDLCTRWRAGRGKWGAFAAACLAGVGYTALATAAVGWAAEVEYVTQVAPQYGYGHVLGQLGNLSLAGWIVATGHGLSPSVP